MTAFELDFFGRIRNLKAQALEDYLRCCHNPDTIHAMCEDYRAGATIDYVLDEADRGGSDEPTTRKSMRSSLTTFARLSSKLSSPPTVRSKIPVKPAMRWRSR